MRVGRCIVSDDFGYMGEQCRVEVKGQLELLCGGRQECGVKVSESLFRRHTPCHKELKEYLDVDYGCLTGQSLYEHSLLKQNRPASRVQIRQKRFFLPALQ